MGGIIINSIGLFPMCKILHIHKPLQLLASNGRFQCLTGSHLAETPNYSGTVVGFGEKSHCFPSQSNFMWSKCKLQLYITKIQSNLQSMWKTDFGKQQNSRDSAVFVALKRGKLYFVTSLAQTDKLQRQYNAEGNTEVMSYFTALTIFLCFCLYPL